VNATDAITGTIATDAVPPHLPVYILVQHEHAEEPFLTFACDTHKCLAASATLDDAKNLAAANRCPVIAHSVRAASRRAMYLVGLYMRHASGRPLCTPRDIGGSSGSPHARELQALCRTGLVRRRRRFRDIARDGSWTYALTAVGDAAATCLIERSNRSWTEEDRSTRMNREEN
jgi:hypothetical protein